VAVPTPSTKEHAIAPARAESRRSMGPGPD